MSADNSISQKVSFDCDPWTGGCEGSTNLCEAFAKKFDIENPSISAEGWGISDLQFKTETKISDDTREQMVSWIKSQYPSSCRGAQWSLK